MRLVNRARIVIERLLRRPRPRPAARRWTLIEFTFNTVFALGVPTWCHT
jgi:hypothetical protein